MDSKEPFLDNDPRLIVEQGEMIGMRVYYNQRVLLYRKDLKLVEVFYEPDSNEINRVAFTTFENAYKMYEGARRLLAVN
jgi:hypothetical protein